ncbi:hypothetical protein NLU13_9788 [Sarocladium strictum]|uniref:Uncharacterized protein n=1 Tax=Sarocladium strictum TaxID=5046 RepID=A0AA39GAP8_SARSR|nr:hypothetical protein NLU13_9788 [Sarocladium strictum]
MSESQREREVQRLYQGWLSAHGTALNVATNVDSLALADLNGTGYKPQGSQDKVLNSLAQLAVLKLDVRRAMVSLVDRDTQMILSEATKSQHTGDANNNELWLGTTVLRRTDAICEHALCDTYTARDPSNKEASLTKPALVVPDCRLDPRFDARPYVVSEPGVRFYAGVPIISPSGLRVGVYAVSDDNPRHGLSIEELHFMTNVAAAVTDHLEWARDRVDRFKGERIVRGLASFIQGSFAGESTASEHTTAASHVLPPRTPLASGRQKQYTNKESRERRGLVRPSGPESLDAGAEKHGPTSPPLPPASSPTLEPEKRPTEPRGKHKIDRLSCMFTRAAEILRDSALADGVVLFGASPGSNKRLPSGMSGGFRPVDNSGDVPAHTTDSESMSAESSDSEASFADKPCKILSFALADDKARADIGQGSPLTISTLERYFAMYPRGRIFSFTANGASISSEEDSASDREPSGVAADRPLHADKPGKRRMARMDHEELLKKIPGAKSVIFVPLYDYGEDRLAGGCFLWTSVAGRMMNLNMDMSYLRAFGNSIMSEVSRINVQKNEAAKTTFIASMSHELRSPLHGILGAAEFLSDTILDSYQLGLITSVSTCGKTLLDTLNHLLDYSKINKLRRAHIRRSARHSNSLEASDASLESLNMTAVVDVASLTEEVTDAIAAGHTFRKLHGDLPTKSLLAGQESSAYSAASNGQGHDESAVSVLLGIERRTSWKVRSQPGALRRIIMNLVGNALKYTTSGFVQVSLRSRDDLPDSGTALCTTIQVSDSGKGMSEEFQREKLFVPFSQEDSFQPGTGLGLSIVKQIVDSLGGTIEVDSEKGKGTKITINLKLPRSPEPQGDQHDENTSSLRRLTEGRRLIVLDCAHPSQPAPINKQIRKLDDTLIKTCRDWFGIQATAEDTPGAEVMSEADMYMYCEPPSIEALQERFRDTKAHRKGAHTPIILVCLNAEEAIRISRNQGKTLTDLGKVVEVIHQPCGPKKLALAFTHCFERQRQLLSGEQPKNEMLPMATGHRQDDFRNIANTSQSRPVHTLKRVVSEPRSLPTRGNSTESISVLASPPPVDPATPSLQELPGEKDPNTPVRIPSDSGKHVLLVDDNPVNLQLLVMFMKKCGFSYAEAEDGLQALNKFQESNVGREKSASGGTKRPFDVVLMDISMPVMNGLESTRHIRDVERQNDLPRAIIIALTGLASADTQQDAKAAGVDIFLPKPVRFAELKHLLLHTDAK